MKQYHADWARSRYTRIAYDCHIPDIREDFLSELDAEATAEAMSKADVTMLQLCAKSHWGLSLHPTKVGKQHPNLKGRDYFSEAVQALNAKGIKCMAYMSDFWDNYAAGLHPEWRQISLEESKGRISPPEVDWIALCPNSGYRQYFLKQIEEVITNYDVAGILIDMAGFFGFCYCNSCKEKYFKATGKEIPEVQSWQDPDWRRFIRWRYNETELIMKERGDLIHRIKPEAAYVHNYHGNFHHYQILSHNTATAHKYSDYLTTETSPWSSYFGMYGPGQQAKFARDCADGKPYDVVGSRNMTGHDFTEKTDLELSFDAYAAVINNCPYMFIESTDWNGLPIKRDFNSIGKAFRRIKSIIPWVENSEPDRYVGILISRTSADFYFDSDKHRIPTEANAIYKICVEKHLPVGYVFDEYLDQEHLSRFKAVVLPDCASLSQKGCDALKEYVKNGGGLVAEHQSTLFDEEGKQRQDFELADVFGCCALSGASGALTWLGEQEGTALADVLCGAKVLFKETPCYVPVKANAGAEVLAARWRGPFDYPKGIEHSSHSEMPYRETAEPLVVKNNYGKGCCVYISPRAGGAYIKYGYNKAREILYTAIKLAAQTNPMLETTAPMAVETVLQKQGNRVVLHFLNYANRPAISWKVTDFPPVGLGGMDKSSTIYDEVIPIYGIKNSISLSKQPKHIYTVPEGKSIEFSYDGKAVSFELEKLNDVCSVCIE
jgi:hypothetical protein